MTFCLLELRLTPVHDYVKCTPPPSLVHQLATLYKPCIAHSLGHISFPSWISLSFMLWIWISSFINFTLMMNFPPCSVSIVIAPEQHSLFDDCPSPMPLCLHNLCHIAALQLTIGEGLLTVEFTTAISRQKNLYSTSSSFIYKTKNRLKSWSQFPVVRFQLPQLNSR